MPSLKRAEARAEKLRKLEHFLFKLKSAIRYKDNPNLNKIHKFPSLNAVPTEFISALRLDADRIVKAIKKKGVLIEDANGFDNEWEDDDDAE